MTARRRCFLSGDGGARSNGIIDPHNHEGAPMRGPSLFKTFAVIGGTMAMTTACLAVWRKLR
jgi:hypothetical protein